MDIRAEAQKIVDQGNGYGVRCADLLKIPEKYRAEVWRAVVEIGKEEDAEEENLLRR